jgi:hypothetical protein
VRLYLVAMPVTSMEEALADFRAASIITSEELAERVMRLEPAQQAHVYELLRALRRPRVKA